MNNFLIFLKIIAWVAGPISSIIFLFCAYGTLTYPGSTDELLDNIKGQTRTYPMLLWFIIAVVCWAFLIAF